MAADSLKLICLGKVMDDENKLCVDYKVADGGFVVVMV